MAVYVLVHGGWGGGWEWRQVAERLAAAGHTAYRPTLTGLGERRHLTRPDIDLDTHVSDVLGLLEFEDLEEIILVGQSYGGAVVTGVVDRAPERVSRVVYVDAFVPADGESVNDLSPAGFVTQLRTLAEEHGGGLAPLPFTDEELGLPEAILAWYAPKLVPHPLATLDQALRLTGRGSGVPRVYVDCRPEDVPEEHWVFSRFAEQARTKDWEYHCLPVGHDAQVLAPDALAALLLHLA
jgi:pimeloyl-ACP methyl ester carboxylesterase